MQIKTISYKRVLSLGNYENKHLELWAELNAEENEDEAISLLMEKVERKIREPQEKQIVNQIQTFESRASNLRQQISYLEERLGELKSKEELTQQTQEPDPNDIPFEGGEAPKTDNELGNF